MDSALVSRFVLFFIHEMNKSFQIINSHLETEKEMRIGESSSSVRMNIRGGKLNFEIFYLQNRLFGLFSATRPNRLRARRT